MEIKEKIKKSLDKILKKDKYRLYLFYKNQKIKTLYVDENYKVFSSLYIVNVYFKKHLFGNCIVKTILQPSKIKFINKEAKKIYIEVDDYIGGGIE